MDIRKTAFFIFTIFLFLHMQWAEAQEDDDLLPLSGMVVDRETLNPIPNVTIKNSSFESATMADSTGYFSLTVRPGDTLIFEAMLYRQEAYVVPEGYSGGRFAVIEALQKDKVLLDEVTVHGFPSQQQFERTFLSADPGGLTEKTVELDGHIEDITDDPTNMQQYILDYNNRYVTYIISREAPPNNFLNPERWAEFIKDWREGRFSDDALEKLEGFPDPNNPADDGDNRRVEPAIADPE